MALFHQPPAPQPMAPPPTATTPATALGADDTARAQKLVARIRNRFSQTLVGQENLRESLITTMVAGGHILIESVPGLAKTTAAQTLATAVSGSFKRVQCTPDLMPSDLVGTQVFDFSTQRFTTQIGPIHANFVLLDEINRSNAKTQSAMLEAMAEGATTIGGQRIPLPKPFMVIATQNPIEEEGTFNLPEAQMDRFMMKAVMTYPTAEQEVAMLALLTRRGSDTIDPTALTHDVIGIQDMDFLCRAARQVHVSDAIMKYAVDLSETSRGAGSKPVQGLSSLVRLGASVPSRQYIPAGANKFLVSVFRSSVDGKHTMRIYKPDGSVYEESIDFMANTTITCSDFYCQTLSDFPQGHYVLALDDHVLDELDIVISDTDNEGAEYPTPRSDVYVLQAGVGWSNGDTTVYAHSGTVLGADELNCLKYSIGFTLTNYSGDSVFVKPTLVNLTRGETILDISDPTEIPHRGISNFWLTTDFPDLAGDYEIQLDGQPVYRFTVTEPES